MGDLETSLTKEDIRKAREEAGKPSKTRQMYDCMLCGWFREYIHSLIKEDCELIEESKQTIPKIFELMETELSKRTVHVYQAVYKKIKDCERGDYKSLDKIPLIEED